MFGNISLKTALKTALLLVALVGGKLASASDPALQPAPVNTSPGTEYGPATRPFQGIPGIARAPGGRLWATWYAGGTDEGPENYVVLVTSGDDGRTWSDIRVVIDPPGDVRAYDPTLWIDPQGRLWWFYAQSFRWWDGRAGVWAVTTNNPQSENPRWSAPRRLADGIMMNKPTVLENGDWLLPISIWTQEPGKDPKHARFVPDNQRQWDAARVGAHVYKSTDGGATFARIGTVKIPNPLFDEHMIVERRGGSLWLLARTRTGMAESISTDGGRTWSEAKPAEIPHVSSRFFIRRLQSGQLLLVKHNPRMDTPWLQGKEVANVWQQRSHLTAYLSRDDGKTWQGGLVLDERVAVSYPDAQQAEDGRIFLIYDFNRKAEKEILMAVFTERDVEAGRLTSDQSRLRVLVNKATGRAP
jgi:predicted neuraminidase